MKNLKNRIEVIEEDLQKKEVKRQQEQKVRRVPHRTGQTV